MRKTRRGPFRALGFIVLLVGLAFAGLLFGRLIRDSGDDGAARFTASAPAVTGTTDESAKTTTASATTEESAKTTTASETSPSTTGAEVTSTPVPASREQWGPFAATAAGRLAKPAARAAAVVAAERVVVLGGVGQSAVLAGVPGGVLRAVASLPSPRAGAAAFVEGGAVFLVGGEQGRETPSDEILRFDPATNRVTSAGRFFEPLAGAGYAQTGNAMYLVGGWTGEKHATAVLRFSPPNTAAVVARLPEALRDPAVALLGGKLYVAGGRTATGLSSAVYAVDPAAGSVSVVGQLPRAVAGGTLVASGGMLYLLGGKEAAGPATSVIRIDPGTGSIEPAGTMPRPLAGAATVQSGAATYVIGGTRPSSVTRLRAG